jgi:hypothetical protein
MIEVIFKLGRTFKQAARYEPVMSPPEFLVRGGVKDQIYRSESSYYEFLINCKDCRRCCLVKVVYYIQKLKSALGKYLIGLFYIFYSSVHF